MTTNRPATATAARSTDPRWDKVYARAHWAAQRKLPRRPEERDTTAWVPSVVVGLVAVAAHFFVLLVYGFSAMASGSCGPDDCAPGVTVPLTVMSLAYYGIFVLTPLAMVAALALPWRVRWQRARLAVASMGLLPHLTVILSLVALLSFG
ncbi:MULTISPECIES: hypothetical protein [Streptomyces]|uniref:Integral membrane protein n=1 Tax=Streptomyces solicathayae TaxID=3081768 RepID=A0ABZ0LXK1_9ACTN|nr:hypothetical protein [Streptomyces sp. HUAS YS2]WOX23504.1 hypothetical protein R2D22_19810 [Streptomyces sp. HUAS YS2]